MTALAQTEAKLVWASTTPIRHSSTALFVPGSELEYNRLAAEVMTAFVFGYKDLALLDPSFYTRDIKNILLTARQEFRNFFKGKIVIVSVS